MRGNGILELPPGQGCVWPAATLTLAAHVANRGGEVWAVSKAALRLVGLGDKRSQARPRPRRLSTSASARSAFRLGSPPSQQRSPSTPSRLYEVFCGALKGSRSSAPGALKTTCYPV